MSFFLILLRWQITQILLCQEVLLWGRFHNFLSVFVINWLQYYLYNSEAFIQKKSVDLELVWTRVSNRTWTRTVNPNEPFHFGEPEPNLNEQNFTSVNLNQTWTLKIVLKWTQTEPEPLTKVRIYFSICVCRWRWYTHNKSSGELQQDQQFLLFFFWTKRVTTVKF